MKTAWTVISIVVLANMLALAGFVGWLRFTGRLDRARVNHLVEMFTLTVEQEVLEKEKAQALEEQAREQALQVARLESVGEGAVTLADRLHAQQQGSEAATLRVERMQREVHDLQRQLELTKQLLSKQRQELNDERKVFTEQARAADELRDDKNFQNALRMYEGVKPKQAKQMFQELMRRGMTDQVVDYLAAMQPRKAATVLKTFKSQVEIEQVADLVQRLRERGVAVDNQQPAGQDPSENRKI